MKKLFVVLVILISTNLLSAEKANRDELLEVFDGKFILIDGQSTQACFGVQGNSIEIIQQKGKCDKLIDISISSRGAICVETSKRESCRRVRVLSNGDFAWGKSRRSITIFDSKIKLLGGASEIDNKGESRLARDYYRQAGRLYKKKKYWKAVEIVKKAADLGHVKAQYRYARALEKGKGADKDIDQAKNWYEKAAIQGDQNSQFSLGNIYRKDGDYKPALKWLQKAANAGSAAAQNNVGYMYKKGMATGWGDPDEALKWYTMAAEGGNKVGQYNVCLILYRKGAHKYTEAKKWCKRSAGQGYRHASDLLEKMNNW